MKIRMKTPCCGGPAGEANSKSAGACAPPDRASITRIGTRWSRADRAGAWKVRWGIGRYGYNVQPGLYAVGDPGEKDHVFVSSNYKLSFDLLRKALDGLNAWILVLDTRGINVWCAAGKGTFGTDELVRRIATTGLSHVVSHRRLILPQLSAPGVAGYEVRKQSGFSVTFGPVRAEDIKSFLQNGMRADDQMRTVRFSLNDRLAVAPVESVTALKYLAILVVILSVVQAATGSFSIASLWRHSWPLLGAVVTGTLVLPALLPWIPFRSFALKGWLLGLAWAGVASAIGHAQPAALARNLLLLPVVPAFLALNFTGSTTFTSQSGVNKEIRLFARPMAACALLGILLVILAR